MKRVLCLILAIVMAWCLAACGKDAPSPTEATPDESVAPTEKPEDPSDGYSISKPHKDIEWVYQKGAMYYSNDEGLWKVSEDGKPQQIVKGEVGAFSTDGTKVIYSAPVDDAEDTSTVCRIAVVNIDGTQDETVIRSEKSNLRPITIHNDTLYYVTDTKDKKGELMAWDKAASKENKEESFIDEILLVSGNKIYSTTQIGSNPTDLYCYHTDQKEYYHVGNDEFTLSQNQVVYAEDDAYYTIDIVKNSDRTNIIVYSLQPDDTVKTAKEVNDVSGNVKSQNCLLHHSSLYYTVDAGKAKEIYRLAPDGEEPEKLNDTGRSGKLYSAGDAVIYQTEDEVFYCSGNELKTIELSGVDLSTHHVLWCSSDTIYYVDGDTVATTQNSLKDEIEPVETESKTGSVEIDGSRPASQENSYVTTARELTADFSGSFYITGEYADDTYTAKNRMPKVMLDSSDASQVNDEIQEKYGKFFDNKSNASNELISRTDYVCYLNDNILSIAIEQVIERNHAFQVYNFDVSNGKQLSNDELFALSDISTENAHDQMMRQAPTEFERITKNQMKMSQSDIDSTEKDLSYAKYYFDSDKQMIALYTLSGTPGSGHTNILLPLDAYYKG